MGQDDVNIKIAAQNAASAALRQTTSDLSAFQAKLTAVRTTAASMKNVLATALGGYALKRSFDFVMGSWSEQEDSVKRLEAVFDATGHAAGLSSEQVQQFATALQDTTRFADETTIAAASVLGTFNKVKGSQFTGALRSAADIATIRGMGLTEAATLVGKALQAPEEGMKRLKRVGIIFDEQVASNIRNLAELGQTAQAQDLILDQLNQRFGGAAQRDLDTYAGAIARMKNAFGELGETVGKTLAGPLADYANYFTNKLKTINGETPTPRVSQNQVDALTQPGFMADAVFERQLEAYRRNDVAGGQKDYSVSVAAARLKEIRAAQNELIKEERDLAAGGLSGGERDRMVEIESQRKQLQNAADDLVKKFGEAIVKAANQGEAFKGSFANPGKGLRERRDRLLQEMRDLGYTRDEPTDPEHHFRYSKDSRANFDKIRERFDEVKRLDKEIAANDKKKQLTEKQRTALTEAITGDSNKRVQFGTPKSLIQGIADQAKQQAEKQKKIESDALDAQKKFREDLRKRREAVMTPQERYDEQLKKLQNDHRRGIINQDLYERERAAARKEFLQASRGEGGNYPGFVPATSGRFLTRGPNVDPALVAQKQIAENTKQANEKLDDMKVGIKGLNDNIKGVRDLIDVANN